MTTLVGDEKRGYAAHQGRRYGLNRQSVTDAFGRTGGRFTILSAASQTLTIGILGVFAAGLLLFIWRRERARGRLARLARRLHLSYTPVDSHGLRERFRGLELSQQGHNRGLFDIVSGSTRSGPVYCFRYRYERGFGIDRCTYQWTVATVELERAVGEMALRHPQLPDERLGFCFPPLGSGKGSPAPERDRLVEDSRGSLRSWFDSLAFPAALECRERLISLQTVDEGSDAQYERLLEAVQEAARTVISAEC